MPIKIKTPIPGPKSIELMERRRKNVARGPFHATPIFAARAEGAHITDVDGNQYLDFASGIGVTNVGHGNSVVVEQLAKQAQQLIHAGFNVTPYENYVQVCEKLNALTPGAFAKKTFLANSGAEAVENAIKIARAYTKRQGVVCFQHAFHGRTYLAMTLTSKAKPYKVGFAPFMPEVYRVPFPYVYRWPTSSDTRKVSTECFDVFKETVMTQITPQNTACVILEPVLGEGGFVPAPTEFLQLLTAFCQEHGILLIADEIQTGFGRTGHFYACEALGFVPDMIISAKGLGGGMPISAVTGRAEIMDLPEEGTIGGTFGGNPVSCAAALAVIAQMQQPQFFKHAKILGSTLRSRLDEWREKFPVVGDVRGIPPMCAMELVTNRQTKEPNPEAIKFLTRHAYENGVIAMSAGTFGNVMRFLPPLSMELEDLQLGLDVIEQGLSLLPLKK